MFPSRRKRRDRDFSPFEYDEFFRDLEDEFSDIEDNLARIFEDMKSHSKDDLPKGPYVYGFSMRMGPDGKPKLEEFGNLPVEKEEGKTQIGPEREPLTDIMERENEISAIFELPGITREDVDLNIDEDSIEINVDTPNRKYHKRMRLPRKVNPETAKANYNNGVLEVKMERVLEKKKPRGRKVTVE